MKLLRSANDAESKQFMTAYANCAGGWYSSAGLLLLAYSCASFCILFTMSTSTPPVFSYWKDLASNVDKSMFSLSGEINQSRCQSSKISFGQHPQVQLIHHKTQISPRYIFLTPKVYTHGIYMGIYRGCIPWDTIIYRGDILWRTYKMFPTVYNSLWVLCIGVFLHLPLSILIISFHRPWLPLQILFRLGQLRPTGLTYRFLSVGNPPLQSYEWYFRKKHWISDPKNIMMLLK